MAITGKTRVAGIIGWPVEHSLSPPMHNAEFERLGLDWVYVPFAVRPEQLPDAVRGLRASHVAGFNVTIPHKQAVMELLDEVAPEARLIGAVNTIMRFEDGRLLGYNTDVSGWVSDIQRDILLRGKSVCVLGGGGAARALATGAATAGAASVYIHNRTHAKGAEILNSLAPHFGQTRFSAFQPETTIAAAREQFAACDVVVNATSIGMKDNPGSPVSADWLVPKQYVYDTIYVPAETELLKFARARGCRVRNGIGMLARQGAEAFRIWTGIEPDAERMEAIIRERITLR